MTEVNTPPTKTNNNHFIYNPTAKRYELTESDKMTDLCKS